MLTSLLIHPLIIIIIITIPFFSLFVCLLLHVFLNKLHTPRPPNHHIYYGPPTYPIIGCLLSFYMNRRRLLDWYTDLLAVSPSQTITVTRYGARRTIVTANPENVEYILKTNFNNYPKGKPFTEILGDFLGNGIFNVDGDLWYSQRKLASHQFTAKSLQEYVLSVLHDEIDEKLLPMLESIAMDDDDDDENKTTVDLQDLLKKVGFNVVCKFSLGFDPCCLDHELPFSPLMEAFDLASEICAKRGAASISAIWKLKRFLGIGSEKQLKDAIDTIHSFVVNVIDEKNKKLNNGVGNGEDNIHGDQDLLSRMILSGENKEVIRDMVISFIMAGKDTTSAAMTWLFYMLSINPDVADKVVKEIENETISSLKEVRLLKACLYECMRLYPPVAWDSKHAILDDLLPDGTVIYAGDRVTYFPYGMGRMENLWGKNRFEFRPERWFVESDGPLIKACAYKFPVFQAGPRVCLGKELAFIQMQYVVASILKRFKFRPAFSNPPKFVPLLTAHMAGGLKVFVHRRHNI